DADPVDCYEALLEFAPPAVDFLIPHANWQHPPRTGAVDIGDWLIAVFDRWYGAPAQETRIRLFEGLMNGLLGGPSQSGQAGLSPVAAVVIETDGAIEQVDSLKSTYQHACATGLNVVDDAFDAALTHPGVVARQIGRAALSDTCLACPVSQACGGGH